MWQTSMRKKVNKLNTEAHEKHHKHQHYSLSFRSFDFFFFFPLSISSLPSKFVVIFFFSIHHLFSSIIHLTSIHQLSFPIHHLSNYPFIVFPSSPAVLFYPSIVVIRSLNFLISVRQSFSVLSMFSPAIVIIFIFFNHRTSSFLPITLLPLSELALYWLVFFLCVHQSSHQSPLHFSSRFISQFPPSINFSSSLCICFLSF